MKNIAVEGMELNFIPSTFIPTDIEIKPEPSDTVFADDNGVYTCPLTITIKDATCAEGTYVKGSAIFTFKGTAQYVEVDGKPVLLEEDEAKSTYSWTSGSSSGTVNVTCKIKSAGQDTVQGE